MLIQAKYLKLLQSSSNWKHFIMNDFTELRSEEVPSPADADKIWSGEVKECQGLPLETTPIPTKGPGTFMKTDSWLSNTWKY